MLGNGTFHGMYNPSAVWANDTRIKFDGVNDNIEILDFKNIANYEGSSFINNFSVSFWFQHDGPVSLGSEQTFWKIQNYPKGGEIIAKYNPTGGGRIMVIRDSVAGTLSSNPRLLSTTGMSNSNFGNLNHFVITVSDSAIGIYVNGSGVTQTTSGSAQAWGVEVADSNYLFEFGRRHTFPGHNAKFLKGYMSNIAIYDSLISSGQVADIYNNGEPKNELRSVFNNADPLVYHVSNERDFPHSSPFRQITMSDHLVDFNGATLEPNA